MLRKMATNVENINNALKAVLERVHRATETRPKSLPNIEPRLVAVSKTKPAADIQAAYQAGQRHFGENYVQELEEKARNHELLEHCKEIKWHFIGHLQRNKAKMVAVLPNLYMVETVDNQKLANLLNNHWEKCKQPGKLKVMIQVNTSGETNKSGCSPEEAINLVKFVRERCPCLEFSGLMTIGAIGYDPGQGPNPDFLELIKCREDVCSQLGLSQEEVELSMGMSSDYEHAIGLGSTNVRVGSTIFGARNNSNKPNTDTSASQSASGSGASNACDNQSANNTNVTSINGTTEQSASGQTETASADSLTDNLNSLDISKDPKES